eukprot:gene2315-2783_t
MVQITITGLSKRNIFKVEENEILSKVYYNFCKKNELDSNKYCLKDSRGKVLDMSLSLRMLKIGNNSTLEIAKTKKGKEVSTIAVVAIDLGESGKHQDSFEIDLTLFEVIQFWEKKLNKSIFGIFVEKKSFLKKSIKYHEGYVVHMNKPYRGLETLSTTTLKSIGISSRDKSILRMQYTETDKTKEAVEKEMKNFSDKLQKFSPRKTDVVVVLETPKVDTKPFSEEVKIEEKIVSPRKEEKTDPMEEEKVVPEQPKPIIESKKEPVKLDTMDIEEEPIMETATKPVNTATIKTTETKPLGVEEWLNKIGLSKYISNFLENDVNDFEIIKELTKSELKEDLGISSFGDCKRILKEIENLKKEGNPTQTLVPATTSTHNSKEETKEQIIEKQKLEPKNQQEKPTKVEFKDTSLKIIPIQDLDAVDIKVFKGSSKGAFTKDELKNEKFELSLKDLKSIGGLKPEEKEQMLMTQKMRETESKKKEKKYEYSLIRVRIGEYVLQGTFLPKMKMESVKQLVDACVTKPETKYYLNQSPPLKKYEDLSKTLKQNDLVPAAILNIGLVDKKDKPLQLKKEIINYCQEFGDEIHPDAVKNEQEEKPKSNEKMTTNPKTERKPNQDQEKDSNKKPKWLKLK